MPENMNGIDNSGIRDNEMNQDTTFLPESPETPNFGPPQGEAGNMPASPGEQPYPLPTPSLPGNMPASPGEQPYPLPTPSLPGNNMGNGGNMQRPGRPNVIIRPIPLPSRPSPNGSNNNNNNQGFCTIRFIHAAAGQQPVNILIGAKTVVNNLQYGEVSSYFTEPEGFQTINIVNSRMMRMIISREVFLFQDGDVYTIVLVNARTGLAMTLVSDAPCRNQRQDYSCVRAANMSYNAPAMDVLVSGGEARFPDLRFKSVAAYRQITFGRHDFEVTETDTGMQVMDLTEQINGGRMYTLYLIGDAYVYPGIEGLFVEDYPRY